MATRIISAAAGHCAAGRKGGCRPAACRRTAGTRKAQAAPAAAGRLLPQSHAATSGSATAWRAACGLAVGVPQPVFPARRRPHSQRRGGRCQGCEPASTRSAAEGVALTGGARTAATLPSRLAGLGFPGLQGAPAGGRERGRRAQRTEDAQRLKREEGDPPLRPEGRQSFGTPRTPRQGAGSPARGRGNPRSALTGPPPAALAARRRPMPPARQRPTPCRGEEDAPMGQLHVPVTL
jgi:hypothetical protein